MARIAENNERSCSVEGCGRVVCARDLCENHYKMLRRNGDPVRRGPDLWTDGQMAVLRQVYEQYPPPARLPMKDLSALLGKDAQSIRSKAHYLGITQGQRSAWPARTLPDRVCAASGCENVFHPSNAKIECCGRSCATRHAWEVHGHPRGMAGKSHKETTKARISETSKAMWANATEDERRQWLDPMHTGTMDRLSHGVPLTTFSKGKGGKRVDLDGRYFRSSWEANYARYLRWLQDRGEIDRWEFEPKTFEFPVKRGARFYTPDFLVVTGNREEWHEVKGWMTQQSATKLKRFAKYYPDEVLVLIDADVYRPLAQQLRNLIPGWE